MWPSPANCHIMTYITHQGGIVLLGDDHPFGCPILNHEHLTSIINQVSGKKNSCTMLIEDYFASIQKKLKKTELECMEMSLLKGLIQRTNELRPSTHTINIDRGIIVANAMCFTYHFEDHPLFTYESPEIQRLDHIPDAYTHRFADFIAEATQLKVDLLKRHKDEYKPCVHEFINSMAQRIDDQLARLNKILETQHIASSASILATTVHWWVLQTMAHHKEKMDELMALDRDFEDFAQDSRDGMRDDEWRWRKKGLEDRCDKLFKKQVELPIEKPSVRVRVIKSISTMPVLRNWFARQTNHPIELPGRELTTYSDPSRTFQDQTKELHDCCYQLRLLVVDSHATLDIMDNLGTEITAIGGDDHIKNITQYLSSFGLEQTDCKVGDISKNEEPLDLNTLPI